MREKVCAIEPGGDCGVFCGSLRPFLEDDARARFVVCLRERVGEVIEVGREVVCGFDRGTDYRFPRPSDGPNGTLSTRVVKGEEVGEILDTVHGNDCWTGFGRDKLVA